MGTMAKKAPQKKVAVITEQLAFGFPNYIGFGFGMLAIIVGFFSLSQGSETLAPILLVLGYCVIIPISIMIKDKPDRHGGE